MSLFTGTADEAMGSKQSGLESPAFEQCSTLQSVQAAYSAGEVEQAQHLARLLCEEAGSSEEKVRMSQHLVPSGEGMDINDGPNGLFLLLLHLNMK